MAIWVVHVPALSGRGQADLVGAKAAEGPETEYAFSEVEITDAAREMRDQILWAVRRGDADALYEAMELNELPPDFGPDAGDDPIAYWRGLPGSADGLAVLALVQRLFALPPGVDEGGAQALFTWPYLASKPVEEWTVADRIAALSLMSPGQLQRMVSLGRYNGARLTIDAAGVWHAFTLGEAFAVDGP